MPHALILVLTMLAAAVVVVVVCRLVRLPPILGYLLVGIVLGDHALNLVPLDETTRAAGEFMATLYRQNAWKRPFRGNRAVRRGMPQRTAKFGGTWNNHVELLRRVKVFSPSSYVVLVCRLPSGWGNGRAGWHMD